MRTFVGSQSRASLASLVSELLESGLTQAEFAKKLGVSQSQVSKMLNQRLSPRAELLVGTVMIAARTLKKPCGQIFESRFTDQEKSRAHLAGRAS